MVIESLTLWSCFYRKKKERKNIAIIINARKSSSDFYFDHFVGAEDIPQSSMLIFSLQNQILGFLKLF